MSSAIGTFVWYDLYTLDRAASTAFFTELFGWSTHDMDMGEHGTYTNFIHGEPFGGLEDAPPDHPSYWVGYIRVADIPATLAKIEAGGGRIVRGHTPIGPDSGYAIFAGADGAVAGLYAGPMPDDAGPTHLGYGDVSVPDVDAAIAFYGDVFGWTKGETSHAGAGPYNFLQLSEHGDTCGMYTMPEGGRPGWTHYVHVDDVAATVARVEGLGGSIIVPVTEVPNAVTFAIAADPTGAIIGIAHNPNPRP